MTLHGPDPRLAGFVNDWIAQRIAGDPGVGRIRSAAELDQALGGAAFTGPGLGTDAAWHRFTEVLAPATLGLASERFLAFIPAAPSTAALLMDTAVSAASFSAESWVEGAGVVHAENEALRWLAQLAGLPPEAGGCFVTGGTVGNLSALAVAREHSDGRRGVIVADTAHSSVANALRLLDMRATLVPTDRRGRLLGTVLRNAVTPDIGTVVASAGSTNAGAVDELDAIADVCAEHALWLHVDGAYGAAALLCDELRDRFIGIERADSVIVDPHKWLFAALGSCALLYRRPALAKAVHAQHASYLDTFRSADEPWNPSDYGIHLTRRASGLPLWFSLAALGVDRHAAGVRRGIELARYAADIIRQSEPLELVMEPQLSVVLFRREGWSEAEWSVWADTLLRDGVAVVTPTVWRGETVGRLVMLHPDTPLQVIDEVLARATS